MFFTFNVAPSFKAHILITSSFVLYIMILVQNTKMVLKQIS